MKYRSMQKFASACGFDFTGFFAAAEKFISSHKLSALFCGALFFYALAYALTLHVWALVCTGILIPVLLCTLVVRIIKSKPNTF